MTQPGQGPGPRVPNKPNPESLNLKIVPRLSCRAEHTPPEVGVRARKFFITFDTNFGRYLPRGSIICGSQKCRIGAFCTIAKNSGEMPKKGLKTGQKGAKFFLALTHFE